MIFLQISIQILKTGVRGVRGATRGASVAVRSGDRGVSRGGTRGATRGVPVRGSVY